MTEYHVRSRQRGTTVRVSRPGGVTRVRTRLAGGSAGGAGLTTEETQDLVAAMLDAGDNVTLTYDDGAGTLTIDAAGGGGGQVADFATITVDTVLTEPKHLIVGGSSPKVTLPDAATWTGQHMVIASNVAYTLTLPDDFGGYDYAKAAYSLTTCISNGGGWQVYDGVPISAGTEGQVLGWQSDVLTWITPAGGADLSDATPQDLGTAAAGTGTAAARDDHVHDMPTAADVGADAAGAAQAVADTLGGAALLDVGTTTGTVAAGDDARLSDARTPTSHNHAASEVTSGTLDIARIPTGTTSTTVPLGNDSRFTDSRTPNVAGSNDDFMQRKAGAWTYRTVAQVQTDLGIPTSIPPLGDLNPVWPNTTDGVAVYPGAGSSAAVSATAVCAVGVTLLKACTVSQVSVNVNAGGATSAVRIGIYNATSGGRPGTLVYDCGTVASTSGGIKTITLAASQSLAAGLYFVATSLDTGTAPTLYGMTGGTSGGTGGNRGAISDNNLRVGNYYFTTTGGAMTSSPTWTLGLSSGAVAANFRLVIASVP